MKISNELVMVIFAVGTAIVTLCSKWILNKITGLTGKIQSSKLEEILQELEEKYLPQAVAFANQTFVEKLKEKGEWSPDKETFQENCSEALDRAYNALLSVMPTFFTKAAKGFFPDWESTLRTRIETFINKQKPASTELSFVEVKKEKETVL